MLAVLILGAAQLPPPAASPPSGSFTWTVPMITVIVAVGTGMAALVLLLILSCASPRRLQSLTDIMRSVKDMMIGGPIAVEESVEYFQTDQPYRIKSTPVASRRPIPPVATVASRPPIAPVAPVASRPPIAPDASRAPTQTAHQQRPSPRRGSLNRR